MPAVSTMIINSLVAIGEKPLSGTLDSTEQTFYLGKLNAMLESWSIDRRAVYGILEENFPLTAGTATYTIGSGGTFNTARPVKIVSAFTRDTSSYDTQLDIIQQAQYAELGLKSVGNTYPSYLYYDDAFVGGLATIYLYPKPTSGLTLYIGTYKQLQSFASVTTALSLPPGYQRAIESNFSIECAPGLTSVSPELAKIAKDSFAAIGRINAVESVARLDGAIAGSGRTNIIAGP